MKSYENFPLWIVLLSNLFTISTYLIGIYIFSQLGLLFAFLYLAYVLFLEFRVIAMSCRYCYYYGKTCAFGKGRCCALIFSKGNPKKFLRKEITMKDMLPDFLVFILPILAGFVILVFNFSWTIVILMAALFVLSTVGNAFIRGSFACKYCKQRGLGCPADKLFSKKK
jgi:hypothetical protein